MKIARRMYFFSGAVTLALVYVAALPFELFFTGLTLYVLGMVGLIIEKYITLDKSM